jgi:hypothetical protein
MPPRQRNIAILVGIMGTILLSLACKTALRAPQTKKVEILITNRTISVNPPGAVHISRGARDQVHWEQRDGNPFTITFPVGQSPFTWETKSSQGQGKVQVVESGPARKDADYVDYKYTITSPDADQPLDPFVHVDK